MFGLVWYIRFGLVGYVAWVDVDVDREKTKSTPSPSFGLEFWSGV